MPDGTEIEGLMPVGAEPVGLLRSAELLWLLEARLRSRPSALAGAEPYAAQIMF